LRSKGRVFLCISQTPPSARGTSYTWKDEHPLKTNTHLAIQQLNSEGITEMDFLSGILLVKLSMQGTPHWELLAARCA
jgi:hypothetical protein